MYYKDDTHYFVMTAKKQSLLEKGVILHVSDQRLVDRLWLPLASLCLCILDLGVSKKVLFIRN